MINLFHLLAINFDVKGVSINAYVNAREKKADNALRNKNRTKKPVFEPICKNSAAFRSSFPVKPIINFHLI